mmetsp:Transcript_11934/g.28112  ORF Transcript_11934/g.28112 Transcript_11934/m.28112 type:complete len:201 (+) Transcript_11934:825-1427(+)
MRVCCQHREQSRRSCGHGRSARPREGNVGQTPRTACVRTTQSHRSGDHRGRSQVQRREQTRRVGLQGFVSQERGHSYGPELPILLVDCDAQPRLFADIFAQRRRCRFHQQLRRRFQAELRREANETHPSGPVRVMPQEPADAERDAARRELDAQQANGAARVPVRAGAGKRRPRELRDREDLQRAGRWRDPYLPRYARRL